MYIMGARIRFFCIPGPRGFKEGDISYRYLAALAASDLGVRAISLGGMDFVPIPSRRTLAPEVVGDPMVHWKQYAKCFTAPIDAKYLNVVRVPPGLQYGTKQTRKDLGPKGIEYSEADEDGSRVDVSNQVVTEAGLALCELLTSNIPNIAITGANPAPTEEECMALCRYDYVFCHKKEDVSVLGKMGVPSIWMSSRELVPFISSRKEMGEYLYQDRTA